MNDEESRTADDGPLLKEAPAPATPELGRKVRQYHLRSDSRQKGEIASGEGVVAPFRSNRKGGCSAGDGVPLSRR